MAGLHTGPQAMLPSYPPSSPLQKDLPPLPISYESRALDPSGPGGVNMPQAGYDYSDWSPSDRRSSSSANYQVTYISPASGLIVDGPAYPYQARVRPNRHTRHRSSSSDNYGPMEGGYGNVRDGSSSPVTPIHPRPWLDDGRGDPSFRDGAPTPEIRVHPFKKLRRRLWILVVVLLCIIACLVWSATCSSLIMLKYCVAGCCQNCANRRTGGCHDCPLICDGIERSLAWSAWGCQHLIRFAKQLLLSRERWEAIQETLSPIEYPPPLLFENPTRNEVFDVFARGFDNVVADLDEVAGRAQNAATIMGFQAINALVDATGPPRPRRRQDDVWC